MLRELITINPRAASQVQSNPRKKKKRKHSAKFRRNPRFMPKGLQDLGASLVPALVGGAGALGVDVLIGQVTMIPAEWKVGAKRTLLRAGLAFAIGFGARFALPAKWKSYADQFTAGALTVVAYDGIKGVVAEKFPELALGAYGGDLSAYERINYNALPTVQRIERGGSLSAYVPAGAGSGDLHGLIPAVR